MVANLKKEDSSAARKTFVQSSSPGVYVAFLRNVSNFKELNTYWKKCKAYRTSVNDYTIYVRSYLEPWLQLQRTEDKLRVGKKILIDRFGFHWEYQGEIDREGLACG